MEPARKYVHYCSIGPGGMATVYHGLNTRDVIVSCFQMGSVVLAGWSMRIDTDSTITVQVLPEHQYTYIDKIVVVG